MERIYCVYTHTVKETGKKYIGMTKNTKERWANGLGYKSNMAFFMDIVKYGWINIDHEIIADCLTKKEAAKLEMSIIDKMYEYNRYSLYNISNTAYLKQRHRVYVYNLDCTLFNVYPNLDTTAEDFDCNPSTISNAIKRFPNTVKSGPVKNFLFTRKPLDSEVM